MSLPLPPLYHWSVASNRDGIIRRGLRPMTPTWIDHSAIPGVCLGTSPSHAWSLSGALGGVSDQIWDLWQVTVEDTDRIRILENYDRGNRMGEVRVFNVIPKSRVWHVGTRTVGSRAWSHV